METITLNVDKSVLEEAQKAAETLHTTLDEMFESWLVTFTAGVERVRKHDAALAQMDDVNAGRKFYREEMNERR